MENTMISQRIRHYRRMAKLSQEELADRVDVSETYIRKLEAGDRFPSLDMVIKLSQALNTTPDHLLLSSSALGQNKNSGRPGERSFRKDEENAPKQHCDRRKQRA